MNEINVQGSTPLGVLENKFKLVGETSEMHAFCVKSLWKHVDESTNVAISNTDKRFEILQPTDILTIKIKFIVN